MAQGLLRAVSGLPSIARGAAEGVLPPRWPPQGPARRVAPAGKLRCLHFVSASGIPIKASRGVSPSRRDIPKPTFGPRAGVAGVWRHEKRHEKAHRVFHRCAVRRRMIEAGAPLFGFLLEESPICVFVFVGQSGIQFKLNAVISLVRSQMFGISSY